MKSLLPTLCLLALLLSGCSDDDDPIRPRTCGPAITIGDGLITQEFDGFELVDARVDGLCLEVTIAATSCSTANWSMELFTFGEVLESFPTQTSARLLFDDGLDETDFTCQVILTETYAFDLSPYLRPATLPTRLTLMGTGTTLSVK